MDQEIARWRAPGRVLCALLACTVALAMSTWPQGNAHAAEEPRTAVDGRLAVPAGQFVVPATGTIYGYVGGYCDGAADPPPPHAAWDISRAAGGVIGASSSGTVTFAGLSSTNHGYKVIISHGGGWETSYSHLTSNILVSAGQSVSLNQPIGHMGGTGTGGVVQFAVHLHFELRLNGAAQSDWNSYFTCMRSVTRGDTISGTPGAGFVSSRIIAPGDFDGDGLADLLGIRNDGNLALFRGDGAGSWLGPGIIIGGGWTSQTRNAYSPGDFDGDGHSDVILERTDGTLHLYRGDGAGSWINSAGTQIGAGFLSQQATYGSGDMNGDGFADVAAVSPDGTLRLYTGDGSGGWLNGTGISIGGGFSGVSTPRFMLWPGDFTGDSFPDLISVHQDGSLRLFAGNGSGGWLSSSTIGGGFSTATSMVATEDLDGDGFSDVVAVWPDGVMKLYTGNGSGGWANGAGIVIGGGWQQ